MALRWLAIDMNETVTWPPHCPCDTASTTESTGLSYRDKLWIGVGAGLGAAVILILVFFLVLCIPFTVNYRQKKKLFDSVSKVGDCIFVKLAY